MAYSGVLVGCGVCWWQARLTCHFVYLRLMTRGLARQRRLGRSRCRSWRTARVQSRLTTSVF